MTTQLTTPSRNLNQHFKAFLAKQAQRKTSDTTEINYLKLHILMLFLLNNVNVGSLTSGELMALMKWKMQCVDEQFPDVISCYSFNKMMLWLTSM